MEHQDGDSTFGKKEANGIIRNEDFFFSHFQHRQCLLNERDVKDLLQFRPLGDSRTPNPFLVCLILDLRREVISDVSGVVPDFVLDYQRDVG